MTRDEKDLLDAAMPRMIRADEVRPGDVVARMLGPIKTVRHRGLH